jgi:Uma2 family endonuclease
MPAVLELPRTTSLNAVRKAVSLALEDESPIVLPNVSWATYRQFVEESMGRFRNPRLYYQKGELLVMPVGAEHEGYKDLIVYIVNILTEEFQINSRSLGSTTFQREDLARGFEPDSCFYFQNEPLIRGVRQLDMTVHPAPDLVIEIDITSLSIMRESIFAACGVPELWRYDGAQVQFLQLREGRYLPLAQSRALPLLTPAKLGEFIAAGATMLRLEWVARVRAWAKEVIAASSRE